MLNDIDLGADTERYIGELVRSGRYGSDREVLRAGVRLLQEREARLRDVEARVAEGREQIARGEGHDADEVFDVLLERYRRWPG